ncbi:rhythmically expressed gene 2 protein-like [Bicyclus anynana]|uniref:Rhythmically expressed gene 2 protein-like n=1 Tax=Bicyclus anynana TaxID=110368 RepID=A0A6J1P8L6_BICAN|nr:rhythmically expressed gene 2 protein-like [Bicyclus anynana]
MFLNGIKLVTFDVTNTLLKFRMPPYDYYAFVAHSHGFKGTGIDIKNRLLSSYKDLTKQHPNFGRDSITWKRWWSRVIEMTFHGHLPTNAKVDVISEKLIEDFKTSSCWEVAEGGVELIRLLKSLGIVVGVISNIDPRLHDILTNLCIDGCFEFVLTSYEVGVCKPDKMIFECAQAKYGKSISSSQCLHIGDDLEKDYNGAKAAGWHALLITDKVKSHSVNTYSNLKELHEAIENKTLQLL